METREKYCVVIPIYRDMVVTEEVALKQFYKTLKRKDNVYALCPEGLDISKHKEIFPELIETRLDKKWFNSTDTYSQLCISKWFYEMFANYEYMLICQLDVWLVKDDIEEWCDKGYEYVGAPIVVPTARWHNYRIDTNGRAVVTPKVGNGGFSLRKIETFIYLCDPQGEIRQRYNITDEQTSKVKYEDLWFLDELDKYYDIERPIYYEAFNFAIDMNPDIIYNTYRFTGMPMAIHAFDKNIPFWKQKIEELSNKEVYEFCYNANKEFIDIYYFGKQNGKDNIDKNQQ